VKKPSTLTLPQQHEYLQRIAIGFMAANEEQALRTRARTDGEKWKVVDELQQMFKPAALIQENAGARTSGLVEQQRYFSRSWKQQ
jgi:hypothetical protein